MLENEVFNRPYVRDITKTCECTCSVTCNPDIITNADRIRAMSDEELAEFLENVHNSPCETCCDNLYWCRRNNAPEPACKNHFADWLRQPVEEG